MKIKELKLKYNGIIERQEKAMAWFASKDFENRFNSEGGVFFERAAIKYRALESTRLKVLEELDKLKVEYTTGNIIHGFDI